VDSLVCFAEEIALEKIRKRLREKLAARVVEEAVNVSRRTHFVFRNENRLLTSSRCHTIVTV
jgi:hypothetical protein